jgi:hypothetical protein
VRVFTKKTNFITAFKFLDLVQSKILANCRAVIEDNVSLKRRFIELAVGKVKSGLRRFLKQLSNRSMMLRNKRSGMERFANLIENGISTAKMRKAWGNILKVYKVKLNLNRLEQKFPLFDKLYTSGLKSSVLETLRNYSSKIQENTKLALVKNLVARQNRKRKIALEALARFNSGFKGAVKFIFKQLKRSEEFKRSAAFERLVLNRFSAEFSDRNVQGVGAKIALTERLMLVAKMKKMIALGAMQRIASQAKKQSELLGRRMVQKIKETYRTALDQLRDNARRLANKEQRTKSLFKKLLGQKYKEALRFGLKGLRDWHGVENKLKSLANCLISVQNRSKNRALKESLQILRHERLTGKMADLQTQKAADKKAFVLKELAKKLKLKTVEALFRLRKLNDKQKQLLKGLFGRFVKNMNFTAMFFLKRLQKNRDLFIYSSDQEKRKIRNFRIANALLRIGDVPKKTLHGGP